MIVLSGASSHPNHGLGDPEQCEHEHLAGLPEQGLHHQTAGESGNESQRSYHPPTRSEVPWRLHFSSRTSKRRELRCAQFFEHHPEMTQKNLARKFTGPRKITEIKNVQVALYIFTNQSDSNMTEVKYNENRFVINSSHNNALQCRFSASITMILSLKRYILEQ